MFSAGKLCARGLSPYGRRRKRKGVVLVTAAFLMILMMALLAFCVDLGYLMTLTSELKRSTDAAALAGAGALIDGADLAELQAFEYFVRNPTGGNVLAEGTGWTVDLPDLLLANQDDFVTQVGHWDPDTRTFAQSDLLPSTISVTAVHRNAPLFFGRFFHNTGWIQVDDGQGGTYETPEDPIDITATSIARYQPRDIALVLDFSASMNDDSELRRIGEYGESVRATVEASLLQIYQDLGSPTYGNMVFEPQYVASNDREAVKETLGLTDVPYPYASGSWNSYIDYVKSSSRINNAGYRKKYGYLTLMNYFLERKPKNNQTADLWTVSAQPIAAVKDAVSVFMDYIQEVDCEDRVALAVYNNSSQEALLEHSLTEDFATVEDIVQHRQAGHYDYYTNIGAGIREGRLELQNNARSGAFKMIVLMTDGIANRPSGSSYARTYALEQAQLAADLRYPIVTISLGNAADTDLMQQIADTTDGAHFNIPGGGTVTDYHDGLMQVFRQIADDRPLILVK